MSPIESHNQHRVDVAELDYDDAPTVALDLDLYHSVQVGKPAGAPRIDDGDIYMLTRQHLRYKAGVVFQPQEVVDLHEIMRATELPHFDIDDADPSTRLDVERLSAIDDDPIPLPNKHPSYAPVSISVARAAHVPPRIRPGYAFVVGAMAAAAIALSFWSPRRTPTASAKQTTTPVVATAAANQPAQVAHARVLDLTPIDVVGTTPAIAEIVQTSSGAQARVAAASPVATKPPQPGELVVQPVSNAPVEPAPTPEPPVETGAFDRSAANAALSAAASSAAACKEPGSASQPASVHVTFAPSGRVTTATVDGIYAGTSVGGCIARAFRSAQVSPFSGGPVTAHKTFDVH